MAQMNCSSCGAPLEIENQFVRSVTCKFCGSTYIVSGSETLNPAGKTVSLADYPSRLKVGMQGQIRGRRFHVLGRARYAYDDGFWEEWQITWDDGAPPDWLEEDEGYWTVYRRERVKGDIPPFEQIRVGSTVMINNKRVFVSEKRTGRLVGSDGQFAAVLPLKGSFGYFQGAADNQTVSVNYWDDEIEISVGDELEHHELVLS
jgi:DNA-directed RNA polymerase subunit RPC12/RpoP